MPDWKQVELLVIQDSKSQKTEGSGWKIRVVQYILDGESKTVKLEKGEYWKDEASGETRFKTKGFSKKDLEACKPHWKDIIGLMDNPPIVQKEAASTEQPPLEGLEEVPF